MINKTAIFMICNLMTNQSVTTLPRLKTLQIQYSRHFQKNDGPVINRRFDTIPDRRYFWKCLEYCICNVLSLGSVVTDSFVIKLQIIKMAVLFTAVLLLKSLLKLRFPTSKYIKKQLYSIF